MNFDRQSLTLSQRNMSIVCPLRFFKRRSNPEIPTQVHLEPRGAKWCQVVPSSLQSPRSQGSNRRPSPGMRCLLGRSTSDPGRTVQRPRGRRGIRSSRSEWKKTAFSEGDTRSQRPCIVIGLVSNKSNPLRSFETGETAFHHDINHRNHRTLTPNEA